MTPEEQQRIYEQEKAHDEARRRVASEREYGGCLGKMQLGVNVAHAVLQIGCGLIMLFFAGLILYLLLAH